MENLTKSERENMLGLLPFDIDCTEKFTPKQYLQKKTEINSNGEEIETEEFLISEKYHPVYHIKPFTRDIKNKTTLILAKVALKGTNQKDKLDLNAKLNEIIRQHTTDITNLYDIGKDELIECPKEIKDDKPGCVSSDLWEKIPEIIKTTLYYRLSVISGISTNEILGL